MNLTILVAIIGAVAVILAAIIGGIFRLIPDLIQRSQFVTVQGIVTDETDMPVAHAKVSIDSQSDMTSNDGRYVISDVPTGTKIIRVEYMSKEVYKSTITIEGKQKTRTFDISISLKPPIHTTTSTGKNSISINQMHGGSIYLSPQGYVTHSNETKFELQIGGVLGQDKCARFSLVSSGKGLYAVDRLYIKLHGYERCKLRDEFITVQAFVEIPAYHFYISPEYGEYDIVPLKPPGSFGTWHYKGEDFDEFFVDFLYEPYTLFIISIELEACDLKGNTKIKKSSGLYKLIWVKQGNTGGCLDLERWYKPKLLELPKAAEYRNELSTFEYQLLTVNLDRDNSYLKSIDPVQLSAIVPKLEEIVSKRQDNLAFKRNLNVIKQYLQQTSIVNDKH